ncbi:SAM-dependent methyltransferase [Actinoplanes sp. CA-015351]|uniref:SAM-dependent methyltransferase n=1 Tax=Actinoplanes sp. CA-015351 TaxID=3239897 RepID=UPI003D971B06
MRTGRSDVHPRTRAELLQFVDGLELVDPGIAAISEWRPDPDDEEQPTPVEASLFGVVARKP